jgi:CDGSH-type Zn-finger protein
MPGVSEESPRIVIERDGPYRVTGRAPVRPAEVVRSPEREPVDVATGDPIPTGSSFALCRCGRSRNKPFCDDSHLTAGVDGTEVADRTPVAQRAFVLEGEGVVVRDVVPLCAKAGFCTNRRTDVWELVPETGDPEARAQMEGMIGRCPSGRLSFAPDAAAPPTEPAFAPEILVERDGPLWIRGGVTLVSADGETYEVRNRMTLCRCGGSGNKPFCDGTHRRNGFTG